MGVIGIRPIGDGHGLADWPSGSAPRYVIDTPRISRNPDASGVGSDIPIHNFQEHERSHALIPM